MKRKGYMMVRYTAIIPDDYSGGELEASGSRFHISSKHSELMDKFKGVTCPNKGVEVGFKYGNSTFILKANRYAFADHDNGNYEVLISNNDYLFELDVHTDENGNINFDDDTFTINIYDAMETDGDMIDCVDVDYIKPLE